MSENAQAENSPAQKNPAGLSDDDQFEDTGEPPSKHMGDLFLAVTLILICIWAAWESMGMPRRGDLGIITSPGFTPLLVSFLLIGLCLIVAVTALRGGALGEVRSRLSHMVRSQQTRRVLILAAIMTGYVLLIGILDFRLITAAFLLVTFWYVRAGRWYTILLAAAFGTALTTMIIPNVFTMPTP